MSIELYGTFVLAVTVLMLIPGPNVALIVGTSIGHGTRFGLVTVAGTSSAMVLQLLATAVGMSTLLSATGHWLEWVRWLGAAYLVVLGIQYWRTAPLVLQPRAASGDARRLYARAFLVSLTNPKVLLFYGAFFPQFVLPGGSFFLQIGLLAATFLVDRRRGRLRLGHAGRAGTGCPCDARAAAQPADRRPPDRRRPRAGPGAQDISAAPQSA